MLFASFSSLINGIFILSGLLIVDTKLSIYSIFIFGILYYLIGFRINKKLNTNANLIQNYMNKTTRVLQDSFGNIRNILQKRQEIYLNEFLKIEKPLKLKTYQNMFFGNLPKPVLEGTALLFLIVLTTIGYMNQINIIPIIAAMALGVQKILQIMQSFLVG